MAYWLNVPFEEKDKAKQLGCRWDVEQKRWWKPRYVSFSKIPEHWIIKGRFITREERHKKANRASLPSVSTQIWDKENNIFYPSMSQAMRELSLTYTQLRKEIEKGKYQKV